MTEHTPGVDMVAQAREWEKDEFDILLDNPGLLDEELSRRRGRTKRAIGVVRSFIHSYHTGGDITGLSEMMKRRLEQRDWNCPRCRCPYKYLHPEGTKN